MRTTKIVIQMLRKNAPDSLWSRSSNSMRKKSSISSTQKLINGSSKFKRDARIRQTYWCRIRFLDQAKEREKSRAKLRRSWTRTHTCSMVHLSIAFSCSWSFWLESLLCYLSLLWYRCSFLHITEEYHFWGQMWWQHMLSTLSVTWASAKQRVVWHLLNTSIWSKCLFLRPSWSSDVRRPLRFRKSCIQGLCLTRCMVVRITRSGNVSSRMNMKGPTSMMGSRRMSSMRACLNNATENQNA